MWIFLEIVRIFYILLEYYRSIQSFAICGLVNVWVKIRNGCGNNYKSQGFLRGQKKDSWMLFLAILGED